VVYLKRPFGGWLADLGECMHRVSGATVLHWVEPVFVACWALMPALREARTFNFGG
jgi:hypothetical protein